MVEIKSNKELTKYINELNSDVELSVSNMREKSLTCSSIRSKWLSYLYLEKENLERISLAKQKIIKQKSSQIANVDSVLRLKREEAIVKDDENIKKLNKLQELTKTNIEYIEQALDILANFSFQIKNTIEVLKWEKSG